MIWLRSILFFFGMVISAIIFCPIAILSWPLPVLTRMKIISLWARFIKFSLYFICNLDFEVEGLDRIPQNPSVILSKHQSAWETIMFQIIFPPQTWVLKREALWIPFFGWGLAATSPISINRTNPNHAIKKLLKEGCKKLKQGRWIVIFPEGTRMNPGESGVYHPGGAMLAIRAGVPIIPVAHNAGIYWGRRNILKRPGVIKVIIGQPIDTSKTTAREANQAAQNWIELQMQSLYER